MDRRGFLTGLTAIIAAPAIVRASSLMPIKAEQVIVPFRFSVRTAIPSKTWRMLWQGLPIPGPTVTYGTVMMTEHERARVLSNGWDWREMVRRSGDIDHAGKMELLGEGSAA